MTYRSFRRVFTNNSMYRSFDKIPYFDSLAHTVEEVLYRRSFNGCDYCFFLGRIQLFDFMTLVAYFISASSEDFARATIKGYLTEMKHYKSGNQYDTQVEYTAEGDLLVTNAKEELITDLLWATHLYATFRFELSSNKDFWKNTMDMLYEMMKDECDWESELAKTDRDSYLEANKVAMKILIEHWLKNKDTDVKEQKTEVPKDIDSKCVSQLQARIAELEAENKELKEQIELLQSPEDAPIDTEGHGAVRLELLRQLMDKAGAQWQKRGNKVIAAQLMAAITGLAPKTCKNHLSDPIVKHTEHQETILDVNSKLNALGIEITL